MEYEPLLEYRRFYCGCTGNVSRPIEVLSLVTRLTDTGPPAPPCARGGVREADFNDALRPKSHFRSGRASSRAAALDRASRQAFALEVTAQQMRVWTLEKAFLALGFRGMWQGDVVQGFADRHRRWRGQDAGLAHGLEDGASAVREGL